MWFDFSLKLSTQSVRLNISLRSFHQFLRDEEEATTHCTEGGRGAEEADDEGEAGGDEQDTSQLFHTQSKTWRR